MRVIVVLFGPAALLARPTRRTEAVKDSTIGMFLLNLAGAGFSSHAHALVVTC